MCSKIPNLNIVQILSSLFSNSFYIYYLLAKLLIILLITSLCSRERWWAVGWVSGRPCTKGQVPLHRGRVGGGAAVGGSRRLPPHLVRRRRRSRCPRRLPRRRRRTTRRRRQQGVPLPLVRRASTCEVPRACLSDRYLVRDARWFDPRGKNK